MCIYNGRRVTRAQFIRLKETERSLEALDELDLPVQYGYDYQDWPILKPTADKTGFDIIMAHWEFLPPRIESSAALYQFRASYDTLNARGERLLTSSLFRAAALNGRCLILSWGFYEYQHVQQTGKSGKVLKAPLKVPYHVTLPAQDYFFMAGISQQTVDCESGETVETFALVTTEANALMAQVHNSKNRMPVILPEELAADWLLGELSPEQINRLATYQFPAAQMKAWPVKKDFRRSTEPTEPGVYENLPQLVL